MKKVLVTGAGGFIGSHLVEHLISEGFQVRAFIHYNSFNSLGNLEMLEESLLEKIEIFYGDISSYDSVYEAMEGINIVFNLAALISIPYSYKNPESYIKVNLHGLMNILNIANKSATIDQVIQMSTSEVYGTPESIPIDEDHLLKAQSPYSASKIAAEKLAESYFNSFDTPVTIARTFNTFGPRQSGRAIIPTIISQALNSNYLRLGNLHTSRDFIYVKDTAAALVSLIKYSHKTIGKVFNIGTGNHITIENIVKTTETLLDKNLKVKQDNQRLRPQNSEVQVLLCNSDKLYKETLWESKYSFEEGLKETINYIKNNKTIKHNKYNI